MTPWWRPASAGLFPSAVYLGLSIALTWPVALGIASNVPGDLGDSLLNMWILAWGAEQVPRLLTFQMGWSEFWNANIFHAEPLSLALSEHLFGQSLQILPVYWLTGNIILCYNLLFLSTFVLSAIGLYLLVRDLTGNKGAAFIAGLVYGFLPYRIASVPHLQVMSSQWMPFALWGLNRFVTTGSIRALAGGTAALVMQNWSCGYYLLYFAPFVPLFAVHRVWAVGALRNGRVWAGLASAALGTLALTLPFLLPYSEAQTLFGVERPVGEIVKFSATAWSYLTASEDLALLGPWLRASAQPEGETFLGLTPWFLAAIALAGVMWHRSPSPGDLRVPVSPWRMYVTAFLRLTVAVEGLALFGVLLFGGFELGPISARDPGRVFLQFAVALTLLLVISAPARAASVRILRSPIFFASAAVFVAVWLSFGPVPYAGTARASGFGLYNLLYEQVPGFNGVRVPARFAMIAGLFLAILAGSGAAKLTARWQRLAAATLIVIEGIAIPIEMNRAWAQDQAMPPARVMPPAAAPPVYARLAALPAGTAITEFPFGDAAWEIRYVFYSAAHWKPITNGYSGHFPPTYTERVARFQRVAQLSDDAWATLLDTGTTHVVVHRKAFKNENDADVVEQWLMQHGASEVERFSDGDVLLVLR